MLQRGKHSGKRKFQSSRRCQDVRVNEKKLRTGGGKPASIDFEFKLAKIDVSDIEGILQKNCVDKWTKERNDKERDFKAEAAGLLEISTLEAEAKRVASALGSAAVRIDHVGSTAVPGLAAKPVIDIQVSVRILHPLEPHLLPLRALGYSEDGSQEGPEEGPEEDSEEGSEAGSR